MGGCTETIKLLIEEGANMEARGHNGDTALLRISFKHHQALTLTLTLTLTLIGGYVSSTIRRLLLVRNKLVWSLVPRRTGG